MAVSINKTSGGYILTIANDGDMVERTYKTLDELRQGIRELTGDLAAELERVQWEQIPAQS